MAKRSMRFTSRQALALSGKDLKAYSRSEMARIVSTVASAANKRITRLEKAGQPITDTIDKFSVAGKSRNELMKEFRRVKDFMNAETLSLSGQRTVSDRTARGLAGALTGSQKGKKFNKAVKEIRDTLGERGSDANANFWRAYERLKESNPIIANKQYKYLVLTEQIKIMQENPGISAEDLQQRMEQEMDNIYTEVQEEQEETEDVFTF